MRTRDQFSSKAGSTEGVSQDAAKVLVVHKARGGDGIDCGERGRGKSEVLYQKNYVNMSSKNSGVSRLRDPRPFLGPIINFESRLCM